MHILKQLGEHFFKSSELSLGNVVITYLMVRFSRLCLSYKMVFAHSFLNVFMLQDNHGSNPLHVL